MATLEEEYLKLYLYAQYDDLLEKEFVLDIIYLPAYRQILKQFKLLVGYIDTIHKDEYENRYIISEVDRLILSVMITTYYKSIVNEFHKDFIQRLKRLSKSSTIKCILLKEFLSVKEFVDEELYKKTLRSIFPEIDFHGSLDTSHILNLDAGQKLSENRYSLENGVYPKLVWSSENISNYVMKSRSLSCDDVLLLVPWLKPYFLADYSLEESRAIFLYTTKFDRYINLPYRKMKIEDHLIEEDASYYKSLCTTPDKNRSLFTDVYTQCPQLQNRSLQKNHKHFDTTFICPEDILGKKFYNLSVKGYKKAIKKNINRVSSVLKTISRRLTREIKRTPVTVYRGIVFDKSAGIESLPSRLTGFTSCSYIVESALYFSAQIGSYVENTKQGVLLEIEIRPDINIFTPDVGSHIPNEYEIVLTDVLEVVYHFDRSYVEYVKLQSETKLELPFIPILFIPCTVRKLP